MYMASRMAATMTPTITNHGLAQSRAVSAFAVGCNLIFRRNRPTLESILSIFTRFSFSHIPACSVPCLKDGFSGERLTQGNPLSEFPDLRRRFCISNNRIADRSRTISRAVENSGKHPPCLKN